MFEVLVEQVGEVKKEESEEATMMFIYPVDEA